MMEKWKIRIKEFDWNGNVQEREVAAEDPRLEDAVLSVAAKMLRRRADGEIAGGIIMSANPIEE